MKILSIAFGALLGFVAGFIVATLARVIIAGLAGWGDSGPEGFNIIMFLVVVIFTIYGGKMGNKVKTRDVE